MSNKDSDAHLEVFDQQGSLHIGEADLDGNINKTKADSSKKPIFG